MSRPRRLPRTVVIGSVGVVVAAALTIPATSASAGPVAPTAATADGGSPEQVIVVLRDQLGATPASAAHIRARTSQAHSDQAAVLRRLVGKAPTAVRNYSVGNAFSATVTADQAAALAADPAVASVVPDRPVSVAPPTSSQTPSATARTQAAAAATPTVSAAACSTNPAKPVLEPEALSTMNVRSDNPAAKTAAALGIDGTGVKVAYIADGINPQNPGFLRKNGKSAIVDSQDFYGDGLNSVTSGAEAFGDASAVVAQGNVVYDVADFANPNVVQFPGGHCYIRIVGVAPGATMVGLKAGSELLPNSAILQAIDYAVTVAHVDVLNESFGGNIYPDSGARNTIQLFDEQAVAAGVTVTVSTGDAGTTGTIGNPATDPSVISAGAITDSRIYEQTGYALATKFSNGQWLDRNISSLSSAGITENGRTIDLSAPGEADWAVCDDGGNFVGCTNFNGGFAPIQSFGGTSQSAPFTAGVAALVIQAYRKAHAGSSPTPAVVKQIITSTARDLGLPGDEQGSGEIDARAAVEAALTWPGATTTAPASAASNIALSTDQLTLSGAPGTTRSGSVTVRNVGTKPLIVVPATRRYATVTSQVQTTAIDAAGAQTTPYPTTAAPWAYQLLTFSVPSGTDQLKARIIWNSATGVGGAGPVVRMSVFAPDGTYAANTRPQGGPAPANYGTVDIRQPVAGTWTAVLYTPQTGGFTGNVTLQTDAERAIPVGSVTPALFTLAPGATRTVTVHLPTPSIGGDQTYTLSLGSSGGHQVAVPVIMRAIVPTSAGTGVFAGTITGGNARGNAPAQTFSYAFDVPAGKRDLDVSVTLADDPGDLLEGILLDPNGEQIVTTNFSLTSPTTGVQGLSMSDVAANPLAGRWRFVVVVFNPVTGNSISQNFLGTVKFNQVQVAVVNPAVALAASRPLAAGSPQTVQLRVTNHNAAPMAVQTDARTNKRQTVQLAPQFAGSTVPLPLSVDDLSGIPAYLVPPNTTRVSLTASSTVPAQVELSSPGFGIDLFGDLASARGGSTVSTATVSEKSPAVVGMGYWTTYIQQIGPFGLSGAPAGSSTLTATAVTAGFDPAVTTSTGDPYLSSVDPTADPGTPTIIAPGASALITVTVTPRGQRGTTVQGSLHLVTTPVATGPFNATGNVIATLPYRYTIA